VIRQEYRVDGLPEPFSHYTDAVRVGDLLFVSGTPGDAAAGLALEQGRLQAPAEARGYLRERFLLPTPRLALGDSLRGFASACIDVSDGLLGDAGKLAIASGLGVELTFEDLPVSEALSATLGEEAARLQALSGGDDYELCFAVPAAQLARLGTELPAERWNYRRIGVLTEEPGGRVRRGGTVMEFSHSGYQHFV